VTAVLEGDGYESTPAFDRALSALSEALEPRGWTLRVLQTEGWLSIEFTRPNVTPFIATFRRDAEDLSEAVERLLQDPYFDER
jgi:hypothetical protein